MSAVPQALCPQGRGGDVLPELPCRRVLEMRRAVRRGGAGRTSKGSGGLRAEPLRGRAVRPGKSQGSRNCGTRGPRRGGREGLEPLRRAGPARVVPRRGAGQELDAEAEEPGPAHPAAHAGAHAPASDDPPRFPPADRHVGRVGPNRNPEVGCRTATPSGRVLQGWKRAPERPLSRRGAAGSKRGPRRAAKASSLRTTSPAPRAST